MRNKAKIPRRRWVVRDRTFDDAEFAFFCRRTFQRTNCTFDFSACIFRFLFYVYVYLFASIVRLNLLMKAATGEQMIRFRVLFSLAAIAKYDVFPERD